MKEQLKSEQNTPEIDAEVLDAAHQVLKLPRQELSTIFEHGHWWVEHRPTGAQWDAVDAEGGDSVNGFSFEQVTQGDDL